MGSAFSGLPRRGRLQHNGALSKRKNYRFDCIVTAIRKLVVEASWRDRIVIFDTTLRDGEQAPGFSLRVSGEAAAGPPARSRSAWTSSKRAFRSRRKPTPRPSAWLPPRVRGPVIAALARCRPDDIERAGEALEPAAPRPHPHLHRDLRPAPGDASCTSRASSASRPPSPPSRRRAGYTDDVQFSAEDATRSDLDFLCRVVESVIKAGATTVNLPDTVGYSTPDEIFEFFHAILARVPNADKAIFSAHCHDDLGLAVANTLAALRAGARQVECTINGIGERAGNASLEEIVMATTVRARSSAV